MDKTAGQGLVGRKGVGSDGRVSDADVVRGGWGAARAIIGETICGLAAVGLRIWGLGQSWVCACSVEIEMGWLSDEGNWARGGGEVPEIYKGGQRWTGRQAMGETQGQVRTRRA